MLENQFDESYGPALIDVDITISGEKGFQSAVLHYKKKCGGHKNGLKVWAPSSNIYYGNDRTKYIVLDAGRRKSTSNEKDNEKNTIYSDNFDENEKIKKDVDSLPERTLIVQNGIVDSSWKHHQNETVQTIIVTKETLDLSLELGTSTKKTKTLARSDRLLQTPQKVANIQIKITSDDLNTENNKNWSSSFLSIKRVYGTLITNDTYRHTNGQTFIHQYQTLSIEHECPSNGWFPLFWGPGMHGKNSLLFFFVAAMMFILTLPPLLSQVKTAVCP
jgi:hypothetical protein